MKLLGSVVLVMAGLAAQGASAQSLFNETWVEVPYKGRVTGGTDAFDSNAGEHFRGDAAANALAAFGVLKVGGVARTEFYWNDGVGIPASYFVTDAHSNASFSDYLTFDGQPAGTHGVLAFDVLLRGDQVNTGAGPWGVAASQWQFDLRVDGQPFQAYRHATLAVNPTDGWTVTVVDSGDAFSLHRYEVPIVFGWPVSMNAKLEGWASALAYVYGADASFEASYDLARSAYWGGIASVTVDGEAVAFGVSSASGTDYRSSLIPVPEPASAALLLLGLAALAAARRRLPR